MAGSEQQAVPGSPGIGSFRAGVTLAAVTSLLTVWTTIVRDDSTGAAYFMIILAVGVGAIAAMFRSAGMARAMLGVAVMQVLLGLLTATAPVTTSVPGGPVRVLLFHAVFAVLWLASAACFRASARFDQSRCRSATSLMKRASSPLASHSASAASAASMSVRSSSSALA